MGVLKTNYFMPTCELVEERLECYNISQKELSERLKISEKHISKLLNNQVLLTIEMAMALEQVIGLNHEILMNYETKYRSFLEKNKIIEELEKEDLEEIEREFQLNFLLQKKWINVSKGDTLAEKVYELLNFFGVRSIDILKEMYLPKISNYAFKEDGFKTEPLLVWIRKCEIESRKQTVGKFDKYKFEENVEKISALITETDVDLFDKIKTLCNESGVYFVMQEAVPNSKVRGAVTWIGNNPIIQISLRYSSNDHFWFAFFHEVGHILLHIKKKQNMIDHDMSDVTIQIEKEADEYSINKIINKDKYEQFIGKMDYKKTSIIDFAKENNIHPGILVGRLQHDGEIPWERFADLKIRYKWTTSN